MEKTSQINLTEGPILNTLTRLSLPIMASSFLSTAYNITDMAWIGVLGSKAVAGVGVGGMYVWLSQGLVSLARMGGQVHVAQSVGKGDRQEAREYARGAIQLTILFGLAFAAVCLLFTDTLLGFFALDDPQSYGYAKIYTQVTCGLILFSYMTQTLTGLFTAQGDSKTPFLANLAGLFINMVFDPVLILGVGPFPRLEVLGAAVATVTAQAIVMLVMLLSLLRPGSAGNVIRRVGLLKKTPAYFYKQIFRMGGPTALQGSIYCMISMVLTRMVSGFGAAAVATQRMGGQIESISWNTADGFGAALNAFAGQNYGARKLNRMKKGYDISFRIVAVWGLAITLLFVLAPEPISKIFFHEADAIAISVNYLIIVGLGEAFMCVELMTIGALSGMGKTKLCSGISILLTGLRIPLAYFLGAIGLGLNGVWWALSATSILKGIVFFVVFQVQMKAEERRKG